MATLHVVCGLPGSGKSTLARQLEQSERAASFTPDEWLIRLRFDGYDAAARAAVEALQWDVAQQLLTLGTNVVLENGFWSKAERQAYRDRATELGADTKLHFLDVPQGELIRRLEARRAAADPWSFVVDPGDLTGWAADFEPPSPDELR